MTIDPKWQFIIALIVAFAVGISQGAVHLANAIPAPWIPAATAWAGIIAFVGSSATAILAGMGMTVSSRNAAATSPTSVVVQTNSPAALTTATNAIAAIPEVSKVAATPLVANAAPSEKVVTP